MEQEDSKKDTEKTPEETSNPQSSQKDDSNKDTNPPEGSSIPELSDKNTPRSLKAKSKIVKKSKAGKFKTMMGKRRNRKNKKVVGNSDEPPKGKGEKAEKNEEKESQNRRTTDKSPLEKKVKSEKAEKNEEKESQNRRTTDKSPLKKSHRAKKNKFVKLDKNEQKQKNHEKHRESDKGTRGRIDKMKHRGTENTESCEKRREKIGGFIFMCSAKTKPDCFHYRVMGVTAGKKEVVLGIKPGTKLFLYDFDLKLLYGIYKASSSGGMKLEPRAFGGNFPAQVRFNVASDCFPLPESIFKKAIKENYNEKNKFKTELTVRQVRKLTELFRPVDIHSSLQPVRSPPKAIIRDREARDGGRESRPHLHREIPNVLSHERDCRIEQRPHLHREIPHVLSHERDPRIEQREEVPRDLFLTEKSYRAYGLQGDRRNVTPSSQVNPIVDPYERDYEREHLHHLDPIYRKYVPAHVESLHADSLRFNESEHQTYFRGAISEHTDDPYHAYRNGASPRDPYLPPLSREEIPSSSYLVGGRSLIGTNNLQRRETIPDRLYSTYSAADALSEYNRMQHYHGEKLEDSAVPVSSRYSFAGPSYSLR